MFVNTVHNRDQHFSVRYDDITRLVYNILMDSLTIYTNSGSWTLDVPYWNKRIIGEFLEHACCPQSVTDLRRKGPGAKLVVLEVEFGGEGDPAEQRRNVLAALLFDIHQCYNFCLGDDGDDDDDDDDDDEDDDDDDDDDDDEEDEEDDDDNESSGFLFGGLFGRHASPLSFNHKKAGFYSNNTIPAQFLQAMKSHDVCPPDTETALCVLSDSDGCASGIVFTDQALYVNCSDNSDEEFSVRYSDITGLGQTFLGLLGNFYIETSDGESWSIDAGAWNKEALREFLSLAVYLN